MKTQFSKEKWLRKKMEKYMPTFEVRKPTAMEVCEAYGSSARLCHLRSDMLGFLMNMSNINSESKVLLVEHTRGFMTGAISERDPKSILRVEFGHDSIKCNNDILKEMDPTVGQQIKVTYVHSKMLINVNKD